MDHGPSPLELYECKLIISDPCIVYVQYKGPLPSIQGISAQDFQWCKVYCQKSELCFAFAFDDNLLKCFTQGLDVIHDKRFHSYIKESGLGHGKAYFLCSFIFLKLFLLTWYQYSASFEQRYQQNGSIIYYSGTSQSRPPMGPAENVLISRWS